MNVKRDVHVVYLVSRDPRVPWYVKGLAVAVAGYALSPIDLIPDFIPVTGLIDDAIIVPLGIVLVLRLLPADVLSEHRTTARRTADPPKSGTAAIVVGLIWLASLSLSGWLVYRWAW